jgi:hypothetical protein
MIQATTRAERISDRLECIVEFFIGSPFSKLSKRLVPYLHSQREFIITKEPCHTSHAYHYKTGKPDWIPAGEHMTLYFWRGCVYRFWNGELTSVDACIDEGLGERYGWDHEKYETPTLPT